MSIPNTTRKFGTPYDFFALIVAAALIVPFFLDPGVAGTTGLAGTTGPAGHAGPAGHTGHFSATDPTDTPLYGIHTQLHLPPCLFKVITGLPCPFCGLTTSFTLLTHGNLGHAFLANPSGPPLYGIMLCLLVTYVILRLRGRENLLISLSNRISGKMLVAVLALMWIARLAIM